jgi:hypothetical protein
MHPVHLAAAQMQHARFGFHRHHPRAQQRAGFAQLAEIDRADAARAAGDEAADGGGAAGGREHAQFPAVRSAAGFDLAELGAGADAQDAVGHIADRVQSDQVQHHAAMQRHRLPVIAGAAAARRHRHAGGGTDPQCLDHVGLGAWRHHEVAGGGAQLLLQHRAVPVEITRFLLHQRRVRLHRNVAERRGERGPVGDGVAHVFSIR